MQVLRAQTLDLSRLMSLLFHRSRQKLEACDIQKLYHTIS